MYYDEALNMKAAGATAITESTRNEADCENWTKVEQYVFKTERVESDTMLTLKQL